MALNNQKKDVRVWRPSMTRKLGVTGFRGVTKNGNGFRAEIYVGAKRINLGTYTTAIEAALVWDNAARVYFGNRTDLNFGVPGEEQNPVEPTEVLPDPGTPTVRFTNPEIEGPDSINGTKLYKTGIKEPGPVGEPPADPLYKI